MSSVLKNQEAFKTNVGELVVKHGRNHVAVLHLTFPDTVGNREAMDRLHSFQVGFLSSLFTERIWVLEKGKRGSRWHVHMIVVTPFDIRRREERKRCRRKIGKVCAAYGFGRITLEEIRTVPGLSRYLAKAFSDGMDYGIRYLRVCGYSKSARTATARFSWTSRCGREYRKKMRELFGDDAFYRQIFTQDGKTSMTISGTRSSSGSSICPGKDSELPNTNVSKKTSRTPFVVTSAT